MSAFCKILSTAKSSPLRLKSAHLIKRFSDKGTPCDTKGDKGGDKKCDPENPEPGGEISGKTIYDSRKYGHELPQHVIPEAFEQVPCIPNGVFRVTTGERLGPGACKCSYYQNPEYFAFHHMTYYDMHLILRCCRIPCPKSGRKPN